MCHCCIVAIEILLRLSISGKQVVSSVMKSLLISSVNVWFGFFFFFCAVSKDSKRLVWFGAVSWGQWAFGCVWCCGYGTVNIWFGLVTWPGGQWTELHYFCRSVLKFQYIHLVFGNSHFASILIIVHTSLIGRESNGNLSERIKVFLKKSSLSFLQMSKKTSCPISCSRIRGWV